jgi:hypothetical protein
MKNKPGMISCGIQILCIIVFLLAGCATAKKTPPQARQERRPSVWDGVSVFRDLQEIDLDGDGQKEIIAIYAATGNTSGVKVIKLHTGEGEIIFARAFNTPNTKFMVKKGVPIILCDEVGPTTGRRFKGAYRWDGRAFVLELR